MVLAFEIELGFTDEELTPLVFGQIAGAAADQVGGDDEETVAEQHRPRKIAQQAEDHAVGEHHDDVDDQGIDEASADEVVRIEGRQHQPGVEIGNRIQRQKPENGDQPVSRGEAGQRQRQVVEACESRVEGQQEDRRRHAEDRQADGPHRRLVLWRHQPRIEHAVEQVDESPDQNRRPSLQTQARQRMGGKGALGFRVAETERQGMQSFHHRRGLDPCKRCRRERIIP